MLKSGFNMPPGCHSVPGDEPSYCEFCGKADLACKCEPCPACEAVSDKRCFEHPSARITSSKEFMAWKKKYQKLMNTTALKRELALADEQKVEEAMAQQQAEDDRLQKVVDKEGSAQKLDAKTRLKYSLARFTGSEHLHQIPSLGAGRRFVMSDGVKFLVEQAKCNWLLDIVVSCQSRCLKDDMLQQFQFWTLIVNPDNTAEVVCERDTDDVFLTQKIEFSDFPLETIRLYVAPQDDMYVVHLPTEH